MWFIAHIDKTMLQLVDHTFHYDTRFVVTNELDRIDNILPLNNGAESG